MAKERCLTCGFRNKWLKEQSKKLPSVEDMAKNLTLSVFNILKTAMRTGKVLADKEVIESRIKICETCPFVKGNRCLRCGCFLSIKAGLKEEKCPIEKW